MARIEIVHPVGIRREEDVRRSACLDLARQRIAAAEGEDHFVSSVRLKPRRERFQCIAEARRGKYRQARRLEGRRRRRKPDGGDQCGRGESSTHRSRGSSMSNKWVIYRRI